MRGEEYVCTEDADLEEAGSGSEGASDEFLQACLPVSGKPLPPSEGPPKDADEYLRQVQWERMHCPEVVEADVEEQPPRRRKRRGLVGRDGGLVAQFGVELPPGARPQREWVEDVVAAFLDLRRVCEERRAEAEGEQRLTFDAWRETCSAGRPTSDLLVAQDFVSLNQLFVVAVEMLVEAAAAAKAGPGAVGGAFDIHGGLVAEWAYASLMYVGEPLVDDIMYQLQRLRRACLDVLAAAHAHASGEPERAAPSSASLGKAALLLTVVEEVFGQR